MKHFLAALFLASQFSGPVVEMTQVAKHIQAGDLEIRNTIQSNDEFGFLAESFNSMADAVSAQLSIQKRMVEISGIMVDANTIDELARGLVDKLTEITQSCLGAFYTLKNDNMTYEQIAFVGANSNLPSFSGTDFEGQFGKALMNGGVTHRADIKIIKKRVVPDWRRKNGHFLTLNDIPDIFESRPELLVIGTGVYGMMKVSPEIIRYADENKIRLIVKPTDDAITEFNRLFEHPNLCACFHLTC